MSASLPFKLCGLMSSKDVSDIACQAQSTFSALSALTVLKFNYILSILISAGL